MSYPARPALILSALLIGTLLGSLPTSEPYAKEALITFLLACICASLPGFYLRSTAIVLSCFLGSLIYTIGWVRWQRVIFPDNLSVSCQGVISQPPDVRANATLLTVTLSGSTPTCTSSILIHAHRYPEFHYGDLIEVKGSLSPPQIINSFNYPLFLARYGVYGVISRPTSLRLLSSNQGNSLLSWLYRLRAKLEGIGQNNIPEPEASFLNGIMLGSKRAIPSDIQTALQATGTSHIVAISGANITILLNLVLGLLPLYRQRQQLWVTFGLALFICLLTGASASVLRGACVACFGRFIKYRSRRLWPFPFLLISTLLLMAVNPLLLAADPGFQLSVAAFAGLTYLGEPVTHFLDTFRLTRFLPEVIRASLVETTAATLGTAIVSWSAFGQLSLLGLVVNPLILWLLEPITSLGLLLLFTGWIPFAVTLIKIPLWLLLHTVLSVIVSFSHTNVGVIHWQPPWWLSLSIVSGLICSYHILKRFLRWHHDLSPPTCVAA